MPAILRNPSRLMTHGMGPCTASAVVDSPMPHRKGDRIGKWTLVDSLGKGGNAEVWRANDGETEVALKILNQRKVHSEPYQRFRLEIEAFRLIGDHDCIMPVLDEDLPESPSAERPAWLAMPIGFPLDSALSQSPLRDVVAAITEIAETLADIGERLNVHHRDIKPSNLYLLDGYPVISDFGLVDLPESVELTQVGHPLGPRYFLAYEMIADSTSADPAPADVFSLAKTLWVLCVDQHWPPQGEQHASVEAYSIYKFRPHPLSHHLDELIERCTRHEPLKRPSMRDVANDLRAWLALENATPQQAIDLATMWSTLREIAEPKLRQVRDEFTQRQCFEAAVRKFQELMEPLHSEIHREFPAAEFNKNLRFVESMLFEVKKHEITNEDIRATILSGGGLDPVQLIIAIAIRTRSDGVLDYRGLVYLGRTRAMGGHIDSWQSDRQRVACGSILQEAKLSELALEIQAMFPLWLEKFTAALDSSED